MDPREIKKSDRWFDDDFGVEPQKSAGHAILDRALAREERRYFSRENHRYVETFS